MLRDVNIRITTEEDWNALKPGDVFEEHIKIPKKVNLWRVVRTEKHGDSVLLSLEGAQNGTQLSYLVDYAPLRTLVLVKSNRFKEPKQLELF